MNYRISLNPWQIFYDALLIAGFILTENVFSPYIYGTGETNPLLFLLISVFALMILGNFCGSIFLKYASEILLLDDPSAADTGGWGKAAKVKFFARRWRYKILRGVVYVYLFSLIFVQPAWLYSVIAEKLTAGMSSDFITLTMIFVITGPFIFVSLGFISRIYGIESLESIIKILRFFILFFLAPLLTLFSKNIFILVKTLPGLGPLLRHEAAVFFTVLLMILILLSAAIVIPLIIKRCVLFFNSEGSSLSQKVKAAWRKVLNPLFLIMALYIWNEGIVSSSVTMGANHSFVFIYIVSMLFGPFPARFLDAVSPPVKPVNFIISVSLLIHLSIISFFNIKELAGF